MCTHALVDSLEFYMDDLVDCFEDFIKKSLILITVAIGAVVAIFVYLMKIMTDRTELRMPLTLPGTPRISRPNIIRVSDASIQSKSFQDIRDSKNQRTAPNDYMMYQDNDVRNTSTSISKVPTLTTMKSLTDHDENKPYFSSSKVPQCENGNACNPSKGSRIEISSIKTLVAVKPCNDCASRSSWKNSLMRSLSAPRMTRFDSGNCMPRHHLSASHPCSKLSPIRTSCCSMCCADDDRR